MADIKALQEKFPILYGNCKRAFPNFFNPDGTMNKRGQKTYARIKTLRRARMTKPKNKPKRTRITIS